jgi:hypothetical protein
VTSLQWAEFAARDFEAATARDSAELRWATPGVMAQAIEPHTKQTPALELIDKALVRLALGLIAKLMIFCPPQIGKSERAVRRFVEWLLDQFPEMRIVVASFDKDVAVRWGRVRSSATSRRTRARHHACADSQGRRPVGDRPGRRPVLRRHPRRPDRPPGRPADHRRPGQGPRRRPSRRRARRGLGLVGERRQGPRDARPC